MDEGAPVGKPRIRVQGPGWRPPKELQAQTARLPLHCGEEAFKQYIYRMYVIEFGPKHVHYISVGSRRNLGELSHSVFWAKHHGVR